jgi:endonuclease/exonuclease/phosphatase family metal-dependent hydrolase
MIMTSFKVTTWNLENLFEPNADSGDAVWGKYQQKLHGLADVILNINPDVLAVQEVGSSAAFNDLIDLLQGRYPHHTLSANPDSRGIRVGFLCKLEIEKTEDILAFPEVGISKVPGLDQQGNVIEVTSFGRGALRIQIVLNSVLPVSLITAHLKSKLLTYPSAPDTPRFSPQNENERARVAGMALLKRTAEAVALRIKTNELLEGNAQQAVVVLGDMNDVPDAATTQILQGPGGSEIGTLGFNRPDQGDDTRLFNLANLIPEEKRFSRIYNGRKELIDHILVSQELLPGQPRKLPVLDSLVNNSLPSISDDPRGTQGERISDHAPITATFEI